MFNRAGVTLASCLGTARQLAVRLSQRRNPSVSSLVALHGELQLVCGAGGGQRAREQVYAFESRFPI